MRYSPAAESASLFRPWALLLAGVVVVAMLFMTYQNKDAFLPQKGEVDEVSVNYAELLLNADPGDVTLRAELVDMLIQLGDLDRAAKYLQGWSGANMPLKHFYELVLNLTRATVNDDPVVMSSAQASLAVFDTSDLSVSQQRQLAELALAVGMPQIAAKLYATLADAIPAEREELLLASARWYLAAGDQHSAGIIYQRLAAHSDSPEQRRDYAKLAYDTMVAGGESEQASIYLLDQLAQGAMAAPLTDWWSRSVIVAQGALRHDLADQLSASWLQHEPDNIAALQQRFDLQLAGGDTQGAWRTGQHLLDTAPASARALKQMALLAQWTGRPQIALDYWIAYLGMQPDMEARERAWRLAFSLFDYNRGIDLLSGVTATRQLTEEELEALVYAQEARGTPEQSERWLRRYLERAPAHRMAWVKLIQNLQNTLQLDAEAQVWKDFSKHHTLTTADRVSWAEVLWNSYQPEQAWQVLNEGTLEVSEAGFWRLRAALAWELEKDDELQASYEAMLNKGLELNFSEEGQLITLYGQKQPTKALELLIASWERTGDPRRLIDAIQLAEQLQQWQQLSLLVKDAEQQPGLAARLPVILAQGLLAERRGERQLAERYYVQGLKANPTSTTLRERLLWLYFDSNNTGKLAERLRHWEPGAQNVRSLWLVMAAANQLLGRQSQALQWYHRYLQATPNDLLVRAAYADALESSGRHADALALRTAVLKQLMKQPDALASDESRLLWLRLVAVSDSPDAAVQQARRWQDGSSTLLQSWFNAQLSHLDSLNQEAQKDDWLAWGRSRGLTTDRYNLIQSAFRDYDRDVLTALLEEGGLDSAQQVEALSQLGDKGRALSVALSELGDEQPLAVRQQLWRQALELTEQHPQGLRVQLSREDFGGLQLDGPQFSAASYLGNDWYSRLDLGAVKYDSPLLADSTLGQERNASLRLERQLRNGDAALVFDGSARKDDNRTGLGVERRWNLGSDQFAAGLDWQRQSSETGLMRALGQQDGVWLNGSHSISARDQISWSLAQRRYETRSNLAIGAGQQASLEFSQIQFFEGPTWVLRSGLELQRNQLKGTAFDDLLVSNGGPVNQDELNADQLLPERVGRFYVGSQWRRGLPGALNRTRGQYTWLLDTSTGWDWEEQSMTYAINAGLGVELLGDDELSLTGGYQSAPIGGDGDSGGNVNLSYSVRFGR